MAESDSDPSSMADSDSETSSMASSEPPPLASDSEDGGGGRPAGLVLPVAVAAGVEGGVRAGEVVGVLLAPLRPEVMAYDGQTFDVRRFVLLLVVLVSSEYRFPEPTLERSFPHSS